MAQQWPSVGQHLQQVQLRHMYDLAHLRRGDFVALEVCCGQFRSLDAVRVLFPFLYCTLSLLPLPLLLLQPPLLFMMPVLCLISVRLCWFVACLCCTAATTAAAAVHDTLLCCLLLYAAADNNEFFVVDFNLFVPGHAPAANTITIVDQVPGTVASADITAEVVKQGYWPSYNIPYLPEVYNISGWPQLVAQYGEWFTYEHTPRAEIFRRGQGEVRVEDHAHQH